MDYDAVVQSSIFFGFVAVIVLAVLIYSGRNRTRFLDVLRAAIEQGRDLSPEQIKAIASPNASRYGEIKAGVIALAIAFGFVGLGAGLAVSDGDWEIFFVLLGVAAFPGFLGAGLIGYGLYMLRRAD